MAKERSAVRRILESALNAMLEAMEASPWVKGPVAFVSQLSERFESLPDDQQDAVEFASDDDLSEAIQLDLIGQHAAFVAAGIVRLEDQVNAIRTAITQARPQTIKFPNQTNIRQDTRGDGNIVVGQGDVHVGKIDMRRSAKSSRAPVVPGTVATDPYRIGYLRYLTKRFNEFKKWEVGRAEMQYWRIHRSFETALKFSIPSTPLDDFLTAADYLQNRVENTKLGRCKRAEGNRLFETFDEYVAGAAARRQRAQNGG